MRPGSEKPVLGPWLEILERSQSEYDRKYQNMQMKRGGEQFQAK